MGEFSNVLYGSCHCENVKIELHTHKDIDAFVPRTCQCSLCKKHDASWISDPEGEAKLILKDRGETNFYRFGHGTSDFVVCKNCGVLTIALCELEGKTRAVLNIKSMSDETFTAEPIMTNFDEETVDERLARRTKNWTNNVIIEDQA
ncbi:MAG: hypothetical protein R3E13_09200 [Alphaproteobacteria bacterium]